MCLFILAWIFSRNWYFINVEDFIVSDSTRIEVDITGKGAFRLKAMDQAHVTDAEFNAGTTDGVASASDILTLRKYSVAAITPDDNCKLLLHLEESASIAIDSSNLPNNGIVNGATWIESGRIDRAISFDGVYDYLTVADANKLDIATAITVELWVKPTGTTPSGTTLLHKCAADSTDWVKIYIQGGQYAVDFHLNSFLYKGGLRGTLNAPADTWTHLTFTYDSTTGEACFYENGYLAYKLTGLSGTIPFNNNTLQIGGETNNRNRYFTGLIDEVAVWSTALSAAQIVEHSGGYKTSGSLKSTTFDTEASVAQWESIAWEEGIAYQDAPIWGKAGYIGALWHLDDTSGTDSSGHLNTLTLSGAT